MPSCVMAVETQRSFVIISAVSQPRGLRSSFQSIYLWRIYSHTSFDCSYSPSCRNHASSWGSLCLLSTIHWWSHAEQEGKLFRPVKNVNGRCLRFLNKQNKYSHQLLLLSYGDTTQSSSTPRRRLIYQSFGLSQLTFSPAHLHQAMRSLFSDFLSEENSSASLTIMCDLRDPCLIFTAANICCWSVHGLEGTSYFGNRNCGECALCHFAVRISPRFLLACQANDHCCVWCWFTSWSHFSVASQFCDVA